MISWTEGYCVQFKVLWPSIHINAAISYLGVLSGYYKNIYFRMFKMSHL